MRQGNPQLPANPFAPEQPEMNRNRNTYAGNQRVLGQLAPQQYERAFMRPSGLQASIGRPTPPPTNGSYFAQPDPNMAGSLMSFLLNILRGAY